MRVPPDFHTEYFLLHTHMIVGTRELDITYFMNAKMIFMWLLLNHFLKFPFPNTITFGGRVQKMNVCGENIFRPELNLIRKKISIQVIKD